MRCGAATCALLRRRCRVAAPRGAVGTATGGARATLAARTGRRGGRQRHSLGARGPHARPLPSFGEHRQPSWAEFGREVTAAVLTTHTSRAPPRAVRGRGARAAALPAGCPGAVLCRALAAVRVPNRCGRAASPHAACMLDAPRALRIARVRPACACARRAADAHAARAQAGHRSRDAVPRAPRHRGGGAAGAAGAAGGAGDARGRAGWRVCALAVGASGCQLIRSRNRQPWRRRRHRRRRRRRRAAVVGAAAARADGPGDHVRAARRHAVRGGSRQRHRLGCRCRGRLPDVQLHRLQRVSLHAARRGPQEPLRGAGGAG